MKMKLFLCVLCLAFFADGLLPQTAPVDEAARLTQVEMMQNQQGEALRIIAEDLGQIKRNSRTEFMWSVGLVLAIFVAGVCLSPSDADTIQRLYGEDAGYAPANGCQNVGSAGRNGSAAD